MRSVAVETAVFTIRAGVLGVLLVRRPGNVWTLPGALLEGGATLAGTASQSLRGQAGVTGVALEQVVTLDRPPGGVCVAYMALIAETRHPLTPGPTEVEVRWFDHDDLPAPDPPTLETIHVARDRLRAKCAYAPIAVQLLPDTFSLGELQAVYEAVLEEHLDPRNFRRDVLAAGVVHATGGVRSERPGRPARLYQYVGGSFAVVPSERRAARGLARGRPPGATGDRV